MREQFYVCCASPRQEGQANGTEARVCAFRDLFSEERAIFAATIYIGRAVKQVDVTTAEQEYNVY